MFFFDACRDYFYTGNKDYIRIIRDRLEEEFSHHPEAKIYIKRIESNKFRTRTILDIIVKFGEKKERKIVAKMVRALLKDKSKGSKGRQLKTFRSSEKYNERIKAVLPVWSAKYGV